MYRLAYRKIGTNESLLTNFTVNASATGSQAAPRWMQINDPGCPTVNCASAALGPSIFQQGSYAPDGTNGRWMGSVDMDQMGDILLGYSVSSGTTFPSIRVAGRQSGSVLGTLPFGEEHLFDGAFSKSNGGFFSTSLSRWGDYSSMKVDQTDGCTFWYAQEYSNATLLNWGTRIGSYRFSNCTNTAASVQVGATTPAAAGSVGYVTVSVRDARGLDASTYRGTMHFPSTDPAAGLPADYTFTSADSGSHTFPVIWNTVGPQTVTATDTTTGSLTNASDQVNVTAAGTHLAVGGTPGGTGTGLPFNFTVTARDAAGNTLTGYTGTVHFTATDLSLRTVLPSDYTFTSADNGAHTFTAKLFTPGSQTIIATDTVTSDISGMSPPINVQILNTFVNGATGDNTVNNCLSSSNPCKTIGGAVLKTSVGGTVTVAPVRTLRMSSSTVTSR
jgi:hypothetical protein